MFVLLVTNNKLACIKLGLGQKHKKPQLSFVNKKYPDYVLLTL